jgi:hypothetical protein
VEFYSGGSGSGIGGGGGDVVMHIAVDADGSVSDGTDEGTIGEGR